MPITAKSGEVDLSAFRRDSSAPARILAADDQEHILEALDFLLRPEGYRVDKVRSPEMVVDAVAKNSYDALLIDLNYTRDTTSGQEGLDLLSQIVTTDATVPVIVMTAWANVELAVEAMRRGARDFVQKPWENERLISIIRTQVELHRALQRAARLEAENRLLRAEGRPDFIATSPAMQPVMDTISRVGPSDANVLITGEHGTGKEVVAQTLHALSPRASRALVAVNTGAIPDGVFESELFGHVKGAFTDARTDRIGRFELADGGTIFLDEIGNVPLRQQAKLLRVLESGEIERVGSSRPRKVNVRVLSATNTDLPAACASGQFREDLLFRLNTVEIHVPPLRERREDIPVLAAHFLGRYAARYRRPVQSFDPAALLALKQYSWPGNVRELEHTIERAVLVWLQPWSLETRLSILGAELFVWWILALALQEQTTRPLQTLSNVISSLREEDYSFRARNASPNDVLGELSLEVNALADMLSDQKLRSVEATALLQRVVDEIDAPLFTFDPASRLRLVNPAGERLLRQTKTRLLGRNATELGLQPCLAADNESLVELSLNDSQARWLLRRSSFRQSGVPHTLVVLSDVSRALREEERRTWQRLLRVLGHELRNSLAPIKFIAGRLSSRVSNA